MSAPEVIRRERFYPHPPAATWNALTHPAVHAWLHARRAGPGNIRPVVGHRFELDMDRLGKQPCEVLAVEPEQLLRYRFATGTLDTIVTWQIVPEAAGARLVLTHEGFDLDSPLGRQALEGVKPSFPGVLSRLSALLR